MKIGRNALCPCGSGKKYKHCCIGVASTVGSAVADDLAQTLAMNPNLSSDELNAVLEQRVNERNHRPVADFCGLSPTQLNNWLYCPISDLQGADVETPDNVTSSPVMRYLELILDEAVAQGGSFKMTAKGNLPTKLVKQASSYWGEFAVAKYPRNISISDFAGANEDKFRSLHYCRVLADLAGIVYYRSGRLHVKKALLKQYQTQGIGSFYLPMLDAAVSKFNWGYFDGYEEGIDLPMFWVFMLWRLQEHRSLDRLAEETATAFPALLTQLSARPYSTASEQLQSVIECRFIDRFLQYWGFVVVNPRQSDGSNRISRMAELQPLLAQTFKFSV